MIRRVLPNIEFLPKLLESPTTDTNNRPVAAWDGPPYNDRRTGGRATVPSLIKQASI